MQEPLLRVTLDYPRPELSPNRKTGSHWAKTSAIKDSVRDAAFYLSKQSLRGNKVESRKMTVYIAFIQADRRKRDIDNLLSASKPAIDGIAKAMGVDDILFDMYCLSRSYDKDNPRMIVEVNYCI